MSRAMSHMGIHPRDLCSYNIPPTVRQKLTRAGFKTSADFAGVTVMELTKGSEIVCCRPWLCLMRASPTKPTCYRLRLLLLLVLCRVCCVAPCVCDDAECAEADISHKDALSVLKEVRGTGDPSRPGGSDAVAAKGGISAMEMYREGQKQPKIITFCGELDEMLGGGVTMGEVTEFCGAPGIGKTQMGIQLAVDVHLPPEFGGSGGHAVYIDTEGSFMVDRVTDIAAAFASHIQKMAAMRGSEAMQQAASRITVEHILEHIHYFRVHDYTEQIAVIHMLPKFLEEHPEVRLVVLDSVAFHFRHDWEDYALRSRLLNSLAQRLMQIAIQHTTAVVLINQITTKLSKTAGVNSSYLAPALGESWAHACTNRIMLTWENGQRYASLIKSPSRKSDKKPYQVTAAGIRGMGSKRPRDARDSAENTNANKARNSTI